MLRYLAVVVACIYYVHVDAALVSRMSNIDCNKYLFSCGINKVVFRITSLPLLHTAYHFLPS